MKVCAARQLWGVCACVCVEVNSKFINSGNKYEDKVDMMMRSEGDKLFEDFEPREGVR